MRKLLLTMTATVAILSASTLTPAGAMTPGTATGIEGALAETSALQDAAYVCRHRYLTSRRVCWWRPGFRWRWWRRR